MGGVFHQGCYSLKSSARDAFAVEDDAGVDEASDEGEAVRIREISGHS